jgi:hypothetical protein
LDATGGIRFAAIIGHADDPDMLRRCIVHHLEIGIERIFVSLNRDDADSARVAREFETTGRVRSARVEEFAPDPFHYFTSAKDVVMRWVAPEWVLFVDSDEFWVPASGLIQDTAGFDRIDIFRVARYNMPPLRESDGTIRDCEISDRATTLLVAPQELINAEILEQRPEMPWILGGYPGKVMVRPQLVAQVCLGAHDIRANAPELRRSTPGDLIILHMPFTTEGRFRRKVNAIRATLRSYGDRFVRSEGWHWRRWLAIDQVGGLHAEFERQLFDSADVSALLSQGVFTTPAQIFARSAERGSAPVTDAGT